MSEEKEMAKMQDAAINQAVQTIKKAILQGQFEGAKAVNRMELMVYFAIGKYISFNTRNKAWGTGALERISEQLRKELPGLRGYSANSMKNMRKFYEQWSMLDSPANSMPSEVSTIVNVETGQAETTIAIVDLHQNDNQIDIYNSITIPSAVDFPVEDFFCVPFTHHIRIIEGVKDLKDRFYYLHCAAEEHLAVDTLVRYIREEHHKNHGVLPNNFAKTILDLRDVRKAVMMFKDEYLLDFINVEEIGERDAEDVDERIVEQQIVHNVKNFIMTFGHDFAFVGNQYHLEIYGVEHFPDLVFFNRELNALVIVELKSGEFKPSYLGQLNAYLAIADDKIRKAHENPTIGIVLCKSANKNYAEYMVRQYDKPMGVATYKTSAEMPKDLLKALPDMEELKKLL